MAMKNARVRQSRLLVAMAMRMEATTTLSQILLLSVFFGIDGSGNL